MGTTTETLPPKLEVARALLLRGNLFLHLAPKHPDVRVPEHLRGMMQLVLEVGLDMAVPIPDLHLSDEGFSGTLSFSRTPFFVRVPWDAVFALRGDDGYMMFWPDSMPADLLAEIEREMGMRAPTGFRDLDVETAELEAREDLLEPQLRGDAVSGETELPRFGDDSWEAPLDEADDLDADVPPPASEPSEEHKPTFALLEGGGAGEVKRLTRRGHLKLIK